jgi:nitric oxide reductase NorQ protein
MDIVPTIETPKTGAVKAARWERSIFWPELDETFHVPKEQKPLLAAINTMAEKTPQNLLIAGPQGCGKTELCMWFAAKHDRPCLLVNCSAFRETKDWFGFRTARDGSVFWHKSDFVHAVTMGGCVIVLDEFNRLHSTLHNSLYPLLDARRTTFIEEMEEIVRVAPGTVFVATCNLGYAHTGAFQMDAALEDLFSYRMDVDFLPTDAEIQVLEARTGVSEATARKLARLAKDIRKKASGDSPSLSRTVSTRQLLATANLMKVLHEQGYDVMSAFETTVLPSYPKDGGADSEQAQVRLLVQGVFGGP